MAPARGDLGLTEGRENMSQISAIGTGMAPLPGMQMPMVTATDGAGAAAQAASAGTVGSSSVIQESSLSTGVSVTSSVQTMIAQFAAAIPQDEASRAMAVLLLLAQLLELLTGKKQEEGQTLGGLSNGNSAAGLLLLSGGSESLSFVSQSSSYEMASTQVYSASSVPATPADGAVTLDVVSPTNTGAAMNAGDGGHQLDVVG
jgi:hypothetical protein